MAAGCSHRRKHVPYSTKSERNCTQIDCLLEIQLPAQKQIRHEQGNNNAGTCCWESCQTIVMYVLHKTFACLGSQVSWSKYWPVFHVIVTHTTVLIFAQAAGTACLSHVAGGHFEQRIHRHELMCHSQSYDKVLLLIPLVSYITGCKYAQELYTCYWHLGYNTVQSMRNKLEQPPNVIT